MFMKKDIDSWNKLFPDCNIHEANLANPSEVFLTKTLINYLRMFGYEVELPVNVADGGREKRLFLIKLVRHVDRFLKITDKSYTFTYYDLLHPTPKKTSHMLGILLNYLYFYNMYKTDVFTMVNEHLRKRQDLLSQIKKTQQDNEQLKTKAKKIIDEVAGLSLQLPKEKNELASLTARHKEVQEQFVKLQESVGELSAEADKLRIQKRALRRQIVPEDEGNELQMQLGKLQKSIAEQEQQKSIVESNLQAHSEDIRNLQDLLKVIEEAKDVVPTSFLKNYTESMKKLEEAKAGAKAADQNKTNKLQMIEKQEQTLKSFEEKLKFEQVQYEQEQSKKLKIIANKEKVCQKKDKQLEYIKSKEHDLDGLLEEQKEIRKYLDESITSLMEPYAIKVNKC